MGGEEIDAGEAEILVVYEYFDRNDVGFIKVVDKTINVFITFRIDVVRIIILRKKEKLLMLF